MSKKIKLDPQNARLHNETNKAQIKKSLEDLGAGRSVVIDNEDYLIAGNGVFEQAEALGIKTRVIESDGTELVVIKRTDLKYKDEKRRKLAIADNAAGETSEWNFEELTEDEIQEWGIEVQEDEQEEIDAVEDDFEVELPEEPISKLGDLYEIGEHRLLCGDSTNSEAVIRLMGKEKARMVFTDPPWNVNYGDVKEGNKMGYKPRTILNDSMSTDDFKDFMGSAFSMMAMASEKGAATYVVMSAQEWGNMMLALHENNYHWSSTIIWNKSHLVMSRKDYHTKYEPIWYGWLDGAPRLHPLEDRKQSDVWDVDRPTKSELHPTTKPIELLNIAIQNSSKNGDLLLDLFLGSGSTMVASHQKERKCYGMELDPKYCDVIVKRMLELDSKLLIKRNGTECSEEFKTT